MANNSKKELRRILDLDYDGVVNLIILPNKYKYTLLKFFTN